MGNEFCRGCQDCSEFKKNEGDFSYFANQPIKNIKNPFLTQNTNTISAVNDAGLNNDISFVSNNYNHKQNDMSTINSPFVNNEITMPINNNNTNFYDKEDGSFIPKKVENDNNNIKNKNNNKSNNQFYEEQNISPKKNIDNKNNYYNFSNYKEDEDNKEEAILDKKVKLITKYFRKLKLMKNNAHTILHQEYFSLSESDYNPNYNGNNELDVNLVPEKNYLYLGTFFNNKKDGLGLELFSDTNAKYFGTYSFGKRVHIGRFTIDNNTKSYYYCGQIKDMYADGYGWHENYKEGTSYEGMWKNSKKQGYGIEYYKDSSVYHGCFLDGKKHGVGYYKWTDNSSYMGEWESNKLHGNGIYKFKDGSIYKGHWKNNRMDGLGEFTFPEIKTYVGFFERDKRAGFGILLWYKENKSFIGFWGENKQNGFGKFIVNNKIRYGYWKEGVIQEKYGNEDEMISKLNDKEKKYAAFLKLSDYDEICNLVKRILV